MIGYAYVNGNKIEDVRESLPLNWRNISNFFIHANNFDYLNQLGWYKVIEEIPTYNSQTQKLDNWRYILENNVVKKIPEVIDIPQPTDQELAQRQLQITADKWQELRAQRDELMRNFEWRYSRYNRQLRLGLTTTDKLEDLDIYMQALADITQQQDPFRIVWPEYVST